MLLICREKVLISFVFCNQIWMTFLKVSSENLSIPKKNKELIFKLPIPRIGLMILNSMNELFMSIPENLPMYQSLTVVSFIYSIVIVIYYNIFYCIKLFITSYQILICLTTRLDKVLSMAMGCFTEVIYMGLAIVL